MEITDAKATVAEGNFLWTIVRVDTDEGISGYWETRNHFATQTEDYADPRELARRYPMRRSAGGSRGRSSGRTWPITDVTAGLSHRGERGGRRGGD